MIIFIEENKDITLNSILSIISETLEPSLPRVTTVAPDNQEKEVCKALTIKKPLLIINSFENIEEQEQNEIFDFLKNLQNHNSQAKVLITARETVKINPQKFNFNHNNIAHQKLKPLCQNQSIELIQQLAAQKKIKLNLEEKWWYFWFSIIKTTLNKEFEVLKLILTTLFFVHPCQRISERSFGVPMAIIHIMAQLEEQLDLHPNQLDSVLNNILPETSRAAQYIAEDCVGKLIKKLRETPAHKLLLSMAIFTAPANINAIKDVAGLKEKSESEIEEELLGLRRLYLMEVTRKGRYGMHPLIREYIFNQEFTYYPNFQEAAQERWVKWYKNFAKDYGGKDWDKWYTEKYNYLNEEWNVLLSLLDWCKKQNRYEDIRDLWKYLKDYASIYGRFTDRIRWMNWLIEESVEREEWFTALHCISSKAWTFIQMWELKEAENLLLSARQLAKFEDLNIQNSLAKHIVYLYIRKGQYEKARNELDRWHKEIVKSLCYRCQERYKIAQQQPHIETNPINNVIMEDEKLITRAKINILYYRGEICFLENKYGKAKKYFQEVIKKARQCKWGKWTRRINYAENWLGDIFIEEAKEALINNELPEAKTLLGQAGDKLLENEAEINYDQRRSAYYKCSRAKLEKCWGNFKQQKENREDAKNHFKKAKSWAESAIKIFEDLEIKKEEQDIVRIEDDLKEIEAKLEELYSNSQ